MPKKVLVVGNCASDHAAMRRALRKRFDVEVVQGFAADDTLELLREEPFALVLVNRRLYGDGSDGIELIRRIKADPQLVAVPVMLLSNFPEYQQEAVAAGALAGFGKADFESPQIHHKLSSVLG
ncbi:MAG: hypothetical protein A3K53_12665 [Deltaproteobacteria bacterium RIFOXYB2_FULL_66_7]|nr:MAG: hypothetical protein A3K53_12665 [Deltaproteobacteria bacterium RIFOXYB2_FULL_66_7]